MTKKDPIAERLAKLIDAKFPTRVAFAARIGVAESKVSAWIKTGNLGRVTTATKLAEVLGVSLDYLVYGDAQDKTKLAPLELQLVESFRRMTGEQQGKLIDVAKVLAKSKQTMPITVDVVAMMTRE